MKEKLTKVLAVVDATSAVCLEGTLEQKALSHGSRG